jgi:putative Ca2+/H+ antiporter (TMEM165/GDT1 family)
LQAFLVSIGVVALGERGDKTRNATVALAARAHEPPAAVFAALGLLTLFTLGHRY